jgi:hypothetical protein
VQNIDRSGFVATTFATKKKALVAAIPATPMGLRWRYDGAMGTKCGYDAKHAKTEYDL